MGTTAQEATPGQDDSDTANEENSVTAISFRPGNEPIGMCLDCGDDLEHHERTDHVDHNGADYTVLRCQDSIVNTDQRWVRGE